MATFTLSNFDQLTSKQLYDLLELRQEVFMLEQQCLYNDIDGEDPRADHLLFYEKEQLLGYLRIFGPDIKFKEPSIGRIVVSPDYRGKDIGKRLIQKGIDITFEMFKSPIRIEAQAALLEYYRSFGFKEEGEIYDVDDIDHIQMVIKY
ncbi:MAG: GNAT family N-acetyltransferase [Balneola sp.]|nr:MAG: GNAT family N-acetyltransferase [Balneola sp.]